MDITNSRIMEINDWPKTSGDYYKRPNEIRLQHNGEPWATCKIDWGKETVKCEARP